MAMPVGEHARQEVSLAALPPKHALDRVDDARFAGAALAAYVTSTSSAEGCATLSVSSNPPTGFRLGSDPVWVVSASLAGFLLPRQHTMYCPDPVILLQSL